MPKIGNWLSATEIACDRCNSKRRVAKTWIEEIKNDHGVMVLRHTQIICTNKECQAAFEKTILADIEKREKLKIAKLEGSARRQPSKLKVI